MKYFGRHTVSCSKPLVNFTFSQKIPATDVRIVPLKISGKRLDVAPFDKLAILFIEYENREAMLELTHRLADLVSIQSHFML